MKKTIGTISVVVLCVSLLVVALVGCGEASLSAQSAKTGLKKAGYEVNEYNKTEFEEVYSSGALKTSQMEGLQTILYGTKKIGDRTDGILLLVFDNIDHADIKDSDMFLMYDYGKKLAPSDENAVGGKYNNVVWAGSQAAKKAAGIN